MNLEISVIIPLYNCSESIQELYNRLYKILTEMNISYEIIFINDGSLENDWEIVKSLGEKTLAVKGISFDKNYGQHNAISCGIKNASGNLMVVMDGDLQDNPEEIPKLYEKAKEGFDLVFASRLERKDILKKRFSSFLYKKLLSFVLGIKLNHAIANFCIIRKSFIDKVQPIWDTYIKFLPSLLLFNNIRSTQIEVKHSKRKTGKSSYNFSRMYKLGIELIFSFARKRLEQYFRIIFYFCLIVSIIISIFLFFSHDIAAKTTIVFSILLIFNLLLMILSLIGIKNTKTLKIISGHNTYNVSETLNIEIVNKKDDYTLRKR